jgi:hypothetical protein
MLGAAPRATLSLWRWGRAPRRNSLILRGRLWPPNRTRRASGFPRPCLCVAADGYCAGAVAAGASAGLPVRRVCRRAWRLWRRSLRWLRRPFRRCVPGVPVASAVPVAGAVGFGTAGAASCATDGSNTPESAKPSVAPKPSRESIFRRETFSISTSLFRGFSSLARQSKPIRMNRG